MAPLTVCRWDHVPSSGSWFLARATSSGHPPLRSTSWTVKATVVLHLGLGAAGSRRRTHPRPVIETTTRGGLRGLSLSGSTSLLRALTRLVWRSTSHEGLCGSPRLAECEQRASRQTVVPFTVRQPFHGSPNFLLFRSVRSEVLHSPLGFNLHKTRR
ncbi:hypothetical protein KY289_008477 [Solanum tuberosum]|nr:hypothetical protein KY289_008477 [Solanum tuberosum]